MKLSWPSVIIELFDLALRLIVRRILASVKAARARRCGHGGPGGGRRTWGARTCRRGASAGCGRRTRARGDHRAGRRPAGSAATAGKANGAQSLRRHARVVRCGSMRTAPLLPLLVVPLVLACPAAAGICWSGMEREGRCSSVAALRVERGECCAGGAGGAGGARGPAAAWSPRDLDSGEIFFYKALAGGVPCTACPESCAGVSCGAGRRCAVREGRARCVCAVSCRRAGAVCGSDGRTYRSLCRLRRRACRHPGKHLALDYPGRCQVGSCAAVRCGGDKRCVLDAELGAHCVRCGRCTTAGAPLCAVDGHTYAGTCALRQAACERGRSLPLAYRGSCIANATCALIRCGPGQRCAAGGASGARCVSCGGCGAGGGGVRRRLCGTDRRTYASWCRLQRAACDRGQAVDPLHVGPCAVSNTTTDNNAARKKKGKNVDKARVV